MHYRRHVGAAAAIVAVVWAGTVGAAGSAHAETDDERFADAVAALKIATTPDSDVPAVGHHICDMLTSGLARNVNPVPTVRGVLSSLQGPGIDRPQAAGLMRAAVGIYCPQHAALLGR